MLDKHVRPVVALQYCLFSGMIAWGKPNMETLVLAKIRATGLAADVALAAMREWFRFAIFVYKVMGPLAGLILDRAGPKACGIIGSCLVLTGAYLLCVSTEDNGYYRFAFLLFFLSNQYIWNSCLWIPRLFPAKKKLVLAVMRIGCDCAQFVPFLLVRLTSAVPVDAALWVLFGLYAAELLVPFVAIPASPDRVVAFEVDHATKPDTLEENRPMIVKPAVHIYHKLTFAEQVATPHFGLFLVFHCVMFMTRTALINNHTFLLSAIPGAAGNTGWLDQQLGLYNMYTLLSIPTGLLFGMLADAFGVVAMTALQGLLALASVLLIYVPVVFLDVESASPYLHAYLLVSSLYKIYVIGLNYAFISDVFGFANIGFLSGVVGLVAGFAVQLDKLLMSLGSPSYYLLGLSALVAVSVLVAGSIALLPSYVTTATTARTSRHIISEGFDFSAASTQYFCRKCESYDCVCA